MTKKSKFILNLKEDNSLFFSKQYVNLGELNFAIEKLENNCPTKKRSEEHKEWKVKINFLMQMYNKLAKYKYYEIHP